MQLTLLVRPVLSNIVTVRHTAIRLSLPENIYSQWPIPPIARGVTKEKEATTRGYSTVAEIKEIRQAIWVATNTGEHNHICDACVAPQRSF